MVNGDPLEALLHSWIYILIAAVGGVLGHMMRKLGVREKVTMSETLLQGVGAAFAGYLVLLACHSFAVPPEVAGVVIGLCGWLGADASLSIMQNYIYKKLKLSKDSEQNNQEK
ncbi:phage holin family protein [Pseudomonas sp. ITA]|uniref:phage holin family protein n=1 Tax=Pseudomonas sp. ITA TaxID=2825841 RepID=UPI002497058B|nr:phage holin family protein [Pseudomonas sp. ITA]MDI2145886.1 phage holin family protein [Pseudomonas sp. ITA]